MEDVELRQLDTSDEVAYKNFMREFSDAGEEPIPASAFAIDESYSSWLKQARDHALGQNVPEGRVPATIYFLVRKSQGKIIGAIDIRHRLNDHLRSVGGNIGYGIVPSERRKGYASHMLSLGLDICRKMKMKKVLITCNVENIASARTILKNGGVFENEVVVDDKITRKRFWIDL